jgi:hypothetical protein
MLGNMIYRPDLILKKQPAKEFALLLNLGMPHSVPLIICKCSVNWTAYVDLAVYFLLAVNPQIILSSWSESDVFRIICHNFTNSLMSSEFCIRCIALIHARLLHP